MPGKLQTIFELLVIAVAVVTLTGTVAGIAIANLSPAQTGRHDFITYWAAGRLALEHKDAYDIQKLLPIERSWNFPKEVPAMVAGNPPWALPAIAAFALLPAFPAGILWLTLSIVALLWSTRALGRASDQPPSWRDVFGYTFAPALFCLLAGQITLFVLTGIAGFIRFHRTRPLLAGAFLFLALLKPHLFFPAACVLALWAIRNRTYSLLAGAALLLGISSAIATWFDPHVWRHYLEMMRTQRLDQYNLPCLSMFLRRAFSPHVPWIQWLPVTLGCGWAVWFFRRHRHHWDWLEHGSLVILVSLVFAPYTWFMDQTIALPALLRAAYLTRSRTALATLALGSALIELTALFRKPLLHGSVPAWSAVFWLLWYLLVTRYAPRSVSSSSSPPVAVSTRAAEPFSAAD